MRGHALLIQEMHAFDERAAALLGVSASSSVVRSMRRTASLRAKRFDPRLTERLANSAARASAHRVDGPDAREPRLMGDRFEDLGAAGAGVTQESL
jgi:hypothetical protein